MKTLLFVNKLTRFVNTTPWFVSKTTRFVNKATSFVNKIRMFSRVFLLAAHQRFFLQSAYKRSGFQPFCKPMKTLLFVNKLTRFVNTTPWFVSKTTWFVNKATWFINKIRVFSRVFTRCTPCFYRQCPCKWLNAVACTRCVLLATCSKFLTSTRSYVSTSETPCVWTRRRATFCGFNNWYQLDGNCTRQLHVNVISYTLLAKRLLVLHVGN